MTKLEDVEQLLRHYETLKSDVQLMIEYCGLMKRSVLDGYRDVCKEIEILQKQAASLTEEQRLNKIATGGEQT